MSAEASGITDGIRLLFQRPNEPLFTTKDNGKTVFELPSTFYTERYATIGGTLLSSRIGVEKTIHLRTIQQPNLDFTKSIKLRGSFSLFSKRHQIVAGELIKILLELSEEDFMSTAAFIKDRVNPYLFLVGEIQQTTRKIEKTWNCFGFKMFLCSIISLRIFFSTHWPLLCSIEMTHKICHCHRLFSNFPINSLTHRYFRAPEKRAHSCRPKVEFQSKSKWISPHRTVSQSNGSPIFVKISASICTIGTGT